MNRNPRAVVATELKAIPRGSPAQNMYRMVYEQARLNALGSHAEIEGTQIAAHNLALRIVRQHQPDFQPELG
jgi:hypothetical protein